MHLGGFERLVERERRADTRNAFGEHRFAAAGRADHEDVVATRDRDLDGALHVLLSLDVGEVVFDRVEFAEDGVRVDAHGLDVERAREKFRRLAQVLHGINIESRHHGGLGRIGRGQDKALFLCLRAERAMASAPFTGRTRPVGNGDRTIRYQRSKSSLHFRNLRGIRFHRRPSANTYARSVSIYPYQCHNW